MPSIEPSYDGPEAESIQQQSLNRWRAALSNAKTASQYRVSPSDLRGLLSRIPSFLDHIPNECKVIQGYSTGGIPINVPLLPNKNALGEYVSAIAIRSFARYLSQKTSNNGKRA
jgi:hypothetical protein